MNISPTVGNVVLEMKDQKERSTGGIYIPQESRGIEFIVLAVHPDAIVSGPGARCCPGDRVLINQKNAVALKVDSRDIIVVPVSDILAVIS